MARERTNRARTRSTTRQRGISQAFIARHAKLDSLSGEAHRLGFSYPPAKMRSTAQPSR